MNRNVHVRCGAGEKLEIVSTVYLLLLDCVLWDSVAVTTVEYCDKADIVGVKGRLQSRVVETEEGNRTQLMVVAEKVTFLSSKKNDKTDE